MNFEKDVIEVSNDKMVIVDFTADWCGPCRMMKPLLYKLNGDVSDVDVAFVDVDSHPEISMRYRVRSVPTILMFYKGQPVSQYVGFSSRPKLDAWVSEVRGLIFGEVNQ